MTELITTPEQLVMVPRGSVLVRDCDLPVITRWGIVTVGCSNGELWWESDYGRDYDAASAIGMLGPMRVLHRADSDS
ncbi:hypothetical protein [Corynebacterium sp.]|uniref:hypothetical protein n=1 Tax=Corynebacterium sp. TaxID=1720 RepID=UPI0028A5BF22|nr:hypothetical protein [Corynebacterium sp.]